MSSRQDSKQAYYQTTDADSVSYAVQCASGTTAYLDFTAGYYDCWAPAGAAGDHFRWKYLALAGTIAAGALVAPTAATGTQTSQSIGMAPANATIRIYVPTDKRIAIVSSVAGPITLYCVKVI